MSRQSHDPEEPDGSDPAPERPVPPREAHASAAPPQPVCRPALQGHALRRHLRLATLAASTRVSR